MGMKQLKSKADRMRYEQATLEKIKTTKASMKIGVNKNAHNMKEKPVVDEFQPSPFSLRTKIERPQ